MIHGKKIVAVIPARAGSKGIPGKNKYRLGSYTLSEIAAFTAQSDPRIDEILVSTDDIELYRSMQKHVGIKACLRPDHLAQDDTKTIEVIRDLTQSKLIDEDAWLLLMQPTSPLRTPQKLSKLIDLVENGIQDGDAWVSVAEVMQHPHKALEISHEGYIRPHFIGEVSVPRQKLKKIYITNGAFYMLNLRVLLAEGTFFPKKTLPFVMNDFESINLDSKLDLFMLQSMWRSGLIKMDEAQRLILEVKESHD